MRRKYRSNLIWIAVSGLIVIASGVSWLIIYSGLHRRLYGPSDHNLLLQLSTLQTDEYQSGPVDIRIEGFFRRAASRYWVVQVLIANNTDRAISIDKLHVGLGIRDFDFQDLDRRTVKMQVESNVRWSPLPRSQRIVSIPAHDWVRLDLPLGPVARPVSRLGIPVLDNRIVQYSGVISSGVADTSHIGGKETVTFPISGYTIIWAWE